VIGLSVSYCIADIGNDIVGLDQVEKIIGGTQCRNPGDWESVITRYRRKYWKEHPDQCEAALRKLLKAGKIFQSSLTDHRIPLVMNSGTGHWVSAESEIKWIPG